MNFDWYLWFYTSNFAQGKGCAQNGACQDKFDSLCASTIHAVYDLGNVA